MANLVNSSRFRSKWKGPYSKSGAAVLARIHHIRNSKKRCIFRKKSMSLLHKFLVSSKSRSSVIQQSHINSSKKIFAHNGKAFIKINLTSDHLGHRLGEFVRTTPRGGIIHKNNKKTKKNKAKK